MKTLPLIPALLALSLPLSAAAPVTLTIHGGRKGVPVAPYMHGLFFEDINYAADGGLYAELVENRSFEHREGMHAWSVKGASSLQDKEPIHPANPRFLRLEAPATITNTGFGGIALKQGAGYRFRVHARSGPAFKGDATLTVRLESAGGDLLAEGAAGPVTGAWARHQVILHPSRTTPDARLSVTAAGSGAIDLDMVSLFPVDTWNKRENGLRADLVQPLADMKPGFIRFPGGCIVEGKDLANAYRWKDTVGPVEHRKQNWNRWQHREAPHYNQTYGLGFFEYFQLCEDIGCQAVPVLNCGMSCQFQDKQFVPVNQLDPWVQDVIDLIEFANGPATSTWGKLRADMGHPAPFGLTMLAVGNEQWGEEYFERYQVFARALQSSHPEIKLISTAGPGVDDPNWNLAWEKFRTGTPADIVDEHYYRPPEWFLANHNRYDSYNRSEPKVFAGEFAAHERNRASTLRAALCEAVGMTGMVRNADVVVMTAYAPLFAKTGATQWTPDLIFFDNTRVMLTPSYHVQSMFARHRPDTTVPLTITGDGRRPPARVGVGTWETAAEFRNITLQQDGRTTFTADRIDPALTAGGNWTADGGTLRQSELAENCRLLLGPEFSGDFTLSLEARKTGGREGFLILFDAKPDGTKSWWNIGGWGNTSHAIEVAGVTSPHVNGKIENNRWYKIRIESKADQLRCFLDDQPIHQAKRAANQPLYACAGIDKQSRELVIQAVNLADTAIETDITLEAIRPAAEATAEVLGSDSLDDVNTFDLPAKVAPTKTTVPVPGPRFKHHFPARSLTTLRIPSA